MGDGVLVYFGWPQAHEDEAERAVRAGLAIVEAVERLENEQAALFQRASGSRPGWSWLATSSWKALPRKRA